MFCAELHIPVQELVAYVEQRQELLEVEEFVEPFSAELTVQKSLKGYGEVHDEEEFRDRIEFYHVPPSFACVVTYRKKAS